MSQTRPPAVHGTQQPSRLPARLSGSIMWVLRVERKQKPVIVF